MSDKDTIKEYMLLAAKNLKDAAESDDIALIWAVLFNTDITIGGYQEAAYKLKEHKDGAWE